MWAKDFLLIIFPCEFPPSKSNKRESEASFWFLLMCPSFLLKSLRASQARIHVGIHLYITYRVISHRVDRGGGLRMREPKGIDFSLLSPITLLVKDSGYGQFN